jgi:hypothetical protein
MGDEDRPTTVDINYVKSVDFREIACDGVVGAPTPRGKLWVAFFTERLPLPRIVRHNLVQGPEPGDLSIDPNKEPSIIDGRAGVIRNVEFGLYLTPQVAQDLHEWLGRQLRNLEENKVQGEEPK